MLLYMAHVRILPPRLFEEKELSLHVLSESPNKGRSAMSFHTIQGLN